MATAETESCLQSFELYEADSSLRYLCATKVDLEEKFAATERENKTLAAEPHRLEGLFPQAWDNVATIEHAATASVGKVASLHAEVERLRGLLKSDKAEREADKCGSELLAAEVEAIRHVKPKLEKEIKDLKASTTPIVIAGEREAAPAAEAPNEAEVTWQKMTVPVAPAVVAMTAFMLVYLRLKRHILLSICSPIAKTVSLVSLRKFSGVFLCSNE